MSTLYHSKRKSQTTLNNGGSLSSGGTSVTVLSAAALPTPPYLAYIEPGVVGQEELIAVTSVASNTLTIIRALDGTTGVSHPDGSAIKNLTASLAWEDLLSIFQLHKHTGADNSASIYATPAVVLGTAAAAGAANTAIRSDSTIVAFDTTAPVTQAFSDTAAAGSATVAARRDHVHGMPSGAYTISAPTSIVQLSGVSFTANQARKIQYGKFVNYVVMLTMAGSTGTSGNVIAVTIPFSFNHNSGQAIGVFRYDRSATTWTGIVNVGSTGNVITFQVPTLGALGASPAFAEVTGDTLWFALNGEST